MPTVSQAFSPTKLLVYQECPRQYFFQYVRRIPRRPTAATSLGSSLHRALRQIYAAGGPKGLSAGSMADELVRSWVDAGFPDLETASRYQEAGQQMLQAYHACAQEEEGQTILLEKRLRASYREVSFFGIVDRVDRLPDATLEVIDYKSTRSIARSAQEVDPGNLQQLGLYAFLVEQRVGGAVTFCSIHYLRDGSRLRLAVSAEWVNGVLAKSIVTVRNILGEQEFPHVFGEHCWQCPYQQPCWREAGQNVPEQLRTSR